MRKPFLSSLGQAKQSSAPAAEFSPLARFRPLLRETPASRRFVLALAPAMRASAQKVSPAELHAAISFALPSCPDSCCNPLSFSRLLSSFTNKKALRDPVGRVAILFLAKSFASRGR